MSSATTRINFEHEKRQFLSKPDKSGAGRIDKDIMNLVNSINSKQDYYTKSSCSGRIILMKETGKKQENVFLLVSHDKISFRNLKNETEKASKKFNGLIYLKMEPCIIHIACNSLSSAFKIVDIARNCGWKKSGIISRRNVVELVSTEILATPVSKNEKIAISDDYLKVLSGECNKKLAMTRDKIKKLEKAAKSL